MGVLTLPICFKTSTCPTPLRDVTISIDGHQLTATTPAEGEAADILAKLHP